MRKLPFFLLAAILIFSSCSTPVVSVDDTPGSPSLSLDTSTPTATIIWFPDTPTWTPFPTIEISATPQLFPGMGGQIYTDDFSDLQTWSFATSESGGSNNIILKRNRLTLAINQSPARLSSLNTRESLSLSDFYAEMTVSVNRCSGEDSYGILFRAASGDSAYRFLLNCSGMARMDHIRGGNVTVLQKPLSSGDAPPAAPGLVKMGVWAAGAEIRLYLNGHYQFSVVNSYLLKGSLGVVANAVSPEGMNISFSDLTVSSVDYVSPTPTFTPTKTPYRSPTPKPTQKK
jgi:hypothetical protein